MQSHNLSAVSKSSRVQYTDSKSVMNHNATALIPTMWRNSSPVVNFKWKATIKRKLREAGGEMKVKKLRKAVVGAYAEVAGDTEGVEELFEAKLAKSGVTVNGKVASLVS
ncbi:hypothetical protein ANCDUO_22662 [Ancylostoma duodenale]|uniref:Cell growth-regulating nucleolar protein-like winged helix domain-containing protein n=2 Tax=Ancylostoma TaxID=29169 RepID=A0A0C2FKH9_9BILA|nr:hypothetical protein ANCDUO_22662 [Ancylostoma duodenale]